jgi:monoamine oxidase
MTHPQTFISGQPQANTLRSQQELSAEARQARIAIVGAGIAGLHAALTLQDAGLSCQVYEAASHIGGRIHSDTTSWAHGVVSEWCGEFIDSDHQTILHLIQRFGLETINLGQAVAENASSILYFFNRYYNAEELQRDFQKLYPLLQLQLQDIGFPTTCAHFTEAGYRLDHLSVYDWIEQYVEGGHTTALGKMLDGACTGFYGLDSRMLSSLNLVYMFGTRGAQGRAVSAGPMSSSRIAGGNQRLPLAIAHSLPADCIRLNHRLTAIKQNVDQTLTLSFATDSGETTVTCDHAILTLPFSTLRHVDYTQAGFDVLKHTAITQLGYGTISKLFLQFDTPYWYQQGRWPQPNNGFIITDLDIQVLWDTSLGQTGSGGLLVNYTSGPHGAAYAPPAAYTTTADSASIQQYAQQCLSQLEQVFPGISAHYTGDAALSYPTGDPYLLGSYSCWCVGQYTLFGGYEQVRQGSVHFAGEHCSISWQGFMEGAASEGARAAQEILHDYGIL